MSLYQPLLDGSQKAFFSCYLDSIGLIERLHRLMLDVIKDEFERLDIQDVNPVQALLLFNVADNEVTAGELRSRGYYQGSNVSYNLRKLVDLGYMHHQRSEVDRRSVRVRLTERGTALREQIMALFERHAGTIERRGMVDIVSIDDLNTALRRVERFWTEQIRYIY